jgi:hypothetical protein
MGDNDNDEWLVERVSPGSLRGRARIAWYRRHAAEIRATAENMKDQAVREQILEIARQYDKLATGIERLLVRPTN